MNFNDYSDELKAEEQAVLDDLISRMDLVIDGLDRETQQYIREAKKAIDSQNPDEYVDLLLAKRGIEKTAEKKRGMYQGRDELYDHRLLLQCDTPNGTSYEELKIGLHPCMYMAERYVTDWRMPVCRHYLLDNASVEYENAVPNKLGGVYHTHFKLLVKNKIKVKFSRVKAVTNLFPGIMDDVGLKSLKGKGFYSDAFLDELIARFNPEEYNPEEAAKIISDEFLQELLERRSSPEFKNIVFSIQKRQGEIIQAPYNRDMVVQGCAGSGKSMIMLHRIPILLYDNPNSLSRTNVYVITPSPMYIQLAEKMRYELEISDINMGTIEQYYDYCIDKYPGIKSQDYGRINYGSKISRETEKYIFSSQCIEDIQNYFDELCRNAEVPLEKANSVLSIQDKSLGKAETYAEVIGNRIYKLQCVLDANEKVLLRYYSGVKEAVEAFNNLSSTLRVRKEKVLRNIRQTISKCNDEIENANNEIAKMSLEKNEIAIGNRKNLIDARSKQIASLESEIERIETDEDYFASLDKIDQKLRSALTPFNSTEKVFSKNTADEIYNLADNAGSLIGTYFMLSWELSRIEDKYSLYVGSIEKDADRVEKCISTLQKITDKYLEKAYYQKIKGARNTLTDLNTNAVRNAYDYVMGKIGIQRSTSGSIRAIKYSPYLFLQVIYQFKGAPPTASADSLLAIDEVQGLAIEEIQLLKNINGNQVIMNLFGDIFQHIEGTKGIDSWDSLRGILDYDFYEMQENYRNASQITNYCNRVFDMKMNAINTPGKGVHEISSDEQFQSEIVAQLIDTQRAGIGAILVANGNEAKYLQKRFAEYQQKLHDMTGEEFSIHRTKWNIMNIDDAKGLEFSSVIVLSGRMTRNQKYIAFTRALDDLYVYSQSVDLSESENSDTEHGSNEKSAEENNLSNSNARKNTKKKFGNEVADFFEQKGIEVLDKRSEGGRLWAIGERENIKSAVNEAIAKFKISGKYMCCKDSNNRNGWCTKTEK